MSTIPNLVGQKAPCPIVEDLDSKSRDKFETPLVSALDDAALTLFAGDFSPKSNQKIPFFNLHGKNNDSDLAVLCQTNYHSPILQRPVSEMAVAITVDSTLWGWIIMYRPPGEAWTNLLKTFLQQISNQISLAITYAQLGEEKMKREAQMEAAKVANDTKSRILANTSHGRFNLVFSDFVNFHFDFIYF